VDAYADLYADSDTLTYADTDGNAYLRSISANMDTYGKPGVDADPFRTFADSSAYVDLRSLAADVDPFADTHANANKRSIAVDMDADTRSHCDSKTTRRYTVTVAHA
jgi:hypothetical protein